MKQHAMLSPSSAHQWVECYGSVIARASEPDPETDASREGTAVHWLAEQALHHREDLDVVASTAVRAPNGVILDKEMEGRASVYVDDVNATVGDGRLFVEHKVQASLINNAVWGTLDAAVARYDKKTIILWDYKDGFGAVSPQDNPQLSIYAVGLMQEMGWRDTDGVTLVFRIVQPRAYSREGPIKEYVCDATALRGMINKLEKAASAVLAGDTKLKAGPHCRYCPVSHKCPALRELCYDVVEYVANAYQLDAMDASALAAERSNLKRGATLLKARIDAIEDELTHRITAGEAVKGLSIKAKAGNLNWSVGTPVALALLKQFGIDGRKDGVITPTQAIAKAGPLKSALKETMASFAKRSSAMVLTEDKDDPHAKFFKKKVEY